MRSNLLMPTGSAHDVHLWQIDDHTSATANGPSSNSCVPSHDWDRWVLGPAVETCLQSTRQILQQVGAKCMCYHRKKPAAYSLISRA